MELLNSFGESVLPKVQSKFNHFGVLLPIPPPTPGVQRITIVDFGNCDEITCANMSLFLWTLDTAA